MCDNRCYYQYDVNTLQHTSHVTKRAPAPRWAGVPLARFDAADAVVLVGEGNDGIYDDLRIPTMDDATGPALSVCMVAPDDTLGDTQIYGDCIANDELPAILNAWPAPGDNIPHNVHAARFELFHAPTRLNVNLINGIKLPPTGPSLVRIGTMVRWLGATDADIGVAVSNGSDDDAVISTAAGRVPGLEHPAVGLTPAGDNPHHFARGMAMTEPVHVFDAGWTGTIEPTISPPFAMRERCADTHSGLGLPAFWLLAAPPWPNGRVATHVGWKLARTHSGGYLISTFPAGANIVDVGFVVGIASTPKSMRNLSALTRWPTTKRLTNQMAGGPRLESGESEIPAGGLT